MLRNFYTAIDLTLLITSMFIASESKWEDKDLVVVVCIFIMWSTLIFNILNMWTKK